MLSPRSLARLVCGGALVVTASTYAANAPSDAERLLAVVRQRLDIVEAYTTEFTQVMGVHTGPGLVALAWWCE